MDKSTGIDYKKWTEDLLKLVNKQGAEIFHLRTVLIKIDTCIRSTEDPIPYIIEILKKELYEDAF